MDPILRYARCSRAAYWAREPLEAELALLGLELLGTRVEPSTGVTLFAARDTSSLVFSFRGTADIRDLLRDAEFALGPFGGRWMRAATVHAHIGFRDGWKSVRDWCDSMGVAHRDVQEVVLTGHSAGGAFATFAASDCYAAPRAPRRAYTYGSPRCGMADFAKAYATCWAPTIRVVHAEDLVPRVPKWPYAHVPGLMRIDDNGAVSGSIGNFLHQLLALDQAIVADIDGEALRDHHIDTYIAALEKRVALAQAA